MKPAKWPSRWRSFVAAKLISRGQKTRELTGQDLKNAEFKTTTQGMGLRMTDHIRSVFRFRWLRKH